MSVFMAIKNLIFKSFPAKFRSLSEIILLYFPYFIIFLFSAERRWPDS